MTTPSPSAHRDICQAREQLMEDISAIIEGYDSQKSPEYLTATLCDAVCKNFPSSNHRLLSAIYMLDLQERIRSRISTMQADLQSAETYEERACLTYQINRFQKEFLNRFNTCL